MIEHSFIFLERVSQKKEQQLWQQGIHTWDDFLQKEKIPGISIQKKLYYDSCLKAAKQLLQQKDLAGLAQLFPKSQHWRLYRFFYEHTIALDIETTGYYSDISVVGLHDNQDPVFLIKNKNLSHETLEHLFCEQKILLTFNGLSFDIPVLIRRFPQLRRLLQTQAHIDLRHVAAKLDFVGGLKIIEEQLGIARKDELDGVCGADAIVLWDAYVRFGDEKALEQLLAYNEADVKNLFIIADLLIDRLWVQIFSPQH